MKTRIIITLSFFLILGSSIVQAQNKTTDAFKVQVDGLGCPFCAFGLEKKFKELKGIKKVAINIETGVFTFTYPSIKNLSIFDVETQVKKAGYTPITTTVLRANGANETSENKTAVTQANFKNVKEDSLFVFGNCNMCKARIEAATKQITGVVSATWNKDTKMAVIRYNSAQVNLKTISKKIAKVGHDTHLKPAKTTVYNALPACCQYERELK